MIRIEKIKLCLEHIRYVKLNRAFIALFGHLKLHRTGSPGGGIATGYRHARDKIVIVRFGMRWVETHIIWSGLIENYPIQDYPGPSSQTDQISILARHQL